MPTAAAGVFLYVETSLHIGAEEPGRAMDPPLHRDEGGLPLVPEEPADHVVRPLVRSADNDIRAASISAFAQIRNPDVQCLL